MNKVFTIAILIAIIFQSCGDDPTTFKKDRVIHEPTLVKILVDIHLMDAITNSSEFYRKFEDIDSVDMYSKIFEKYGVSRIEFDTTVAIYSRKPELFLEVYDKVMLDLNLRIDELKENDEELKDQEIEKAEEMEQNPKSRKIEEVRSKF